MILPSAKDAVHKAWLYRTLRAIYDNPLLATSLYFKGGTCAAMLGWLDRFSVDLDFDFVGSRKDMAAVRKGLEKVFGELGLEVKDKSKVVPQYFLRYPVPDGNRNTIKIDVTFPPPKANKYAPQKFTDIERVVYSQTKETWFANKLVALPERYEKRQAIAGRDLYDIHHFFLQGFRYDQGVIEERRKTHVRQFFLRLLAFVQRHVTQTLIDQDLNTLLPSAHFKRIRKVLKRETLMFLRDELARLE